MTSDHRKDVIALFAIGAAATLLIVGLVLRSAHGTTSDPLTAVPVDSFLVATLDVRALAESPIGQAIVGGDDKHARTGAIFGVDSIEGTCGFDPLPHLRGLALTVPEGETHGELGLVATGDLAKSALESCAEAVIAKRGGHASTRQSGSFTIVSDDGARSGALAFRDGGPFLVGPSPGGQTTAWLDAMIDATLGRRPSMAASGSDLHHAMRADLRRRDPDATALVASAIVPRELRERVRSEMEGASAGNDGKLGPSMDGVLAVGGVAFAIHAGRAGEDMRFTGEVRCDGDRADAPDTAAAACAKIEKMLLHFRLGWSGDLRLRLLGLGPLIDAMETERAGSTLIVRTHAPSADLARMLTRLLEMQSPPRPARHAGAPPAPAPTPDEILRPAGSASARP